MKEKILIMSDNPFLATGFRNQAVNLANTLSEAGYEVVYLGAQYIGQPIKCATLADGRLLNFRIIPGSQRHQYVGPELQDVLYKEKPDVFIILLDTFMVYPWFLNLNLPKSVFWYPSDGGFFPQNCENILKKVSHPVAMAKFGQEQLKLTYNVVTDYIPHGVSTKAFHPVSPELKNKLRQKYSQKFGVDLSNKFIVSCIGRNQGRKNMERVIRSFSMFAKGKSDVLLMMHMDPADQAAIQDLPYLSQRFGVNNKVLWTGMRAFNAFNDSEMPELYQISDLQFSTTSGEGFGICTVESMACGVPVLITDYTTTRELVTDHNAGLGIDLLGENVYPYPAEQMLEGTVVGSWNVDRGFCSLNDAVSKLDFFYANPEERLRMGDNGRKAAVKYYDWDGVVAKAWLNKIQEMLR